MPGTAKSSRAPSSAAENLLWFFLRDGQVGDFQFHRRIVIGREVADFVCFEIGLAIEIEVGSAPGERPDERPRRGALEAYGFRVLRFAAHDVLLGTESVLEAILEALLSPPINVPSASLDESRNGGPTPRSGPPATRS